MGHTNPIKTSCYRHTIYSCQQTILTSANTTLSVIFTIICQNIFESTKKFSQEFPKKNSRGIGLCDNIIANHN